MPSARTMVGRSPRKAGKNEAACRGAGVWSIGSPILQRVLKCGYVSGADYVVRYADTSCSVGVVPVVHAAGSVVRSVRRLVSAMYEPCDANQLVDALS